MITQKEIAKHLNLSHQVVSLCFTHPDRVRSETKEKILKTADEMGYRLNSSARAISTGRFDNIVLVISSERNNTLQSPELMYGIHDELTKDDIHFSLASIEDHDLENEFFVPGILQKWNSDGMLINYSTQIPPRLAALIEKYRIPCIWIHSKQKADCVYPDFYDAGKKATEYLIGLGHRKIAYADFSCMGHYTASELRDSYKSTMKKMGLNPMFLGCKNTLPRSEREDAADKFISQKSTTAIISFASSTLLPILQSLWKKGLSVPDDMSIITFSDQLYDETGLEISTMTCPYYQMGIKAVQMLKEKIAVPEKSLKPCAIPLNLEKGKSCASPNEVKS